MQSIPGKAITLQVPYEFKPLLDSIASKHGIKPAQALRALFLLGGEVYSDVHNGKLPRASPGVLRLLAYCAEHGRPYEEKVFSSLL